MAVHFKTSNILSITIGIDITYLDLFVNNQNLAKGRVRVPKRKETNLTRPHIADPGTSAQLSKGKVNGPEVPAKCLPSTDPKWARMKGVKEIVKPFWTRFLFLCAETHRVVREDHFITISIQSFSYKVLSQPTRTAFDGVWPFPSYHELCPLLCQSVELSFCENRTVLSKVQCNCDISLPFCHTIALCSFTWPMQDPYMIPQIPRLVCIRHTVNPRANMSNSRLTMNIFAAQSKYQYVRNILIKIS